MNLDILTLNKSPCFKVDKATKYYFMLEDEI